MKRYIPTEEERIRHTIIKAMKKKKISRVRLAEELGMGKSTLSHRLCGAREFKLSELIEICDILEIELTI